MPEHNTPSERTGLIQGSAREDPNAPHMPVTGGIRDQERPLFHHLQLWHVPILHLLISVATVVGMILLLDGYLAQEGDARNPWEFVNEYDAGGGWYRLRVSEVTTVISTAMVAVKILATSWATASIWRCAFILLEKGGLELNRLSRLMSWGLPVVWPRGRESWGATIVLLLLCPQPFITPILTGAVGWSASWQHTLSNKVHVTARSCAGITWSELTDTWFMERGWVSISPSQKTSSSNLTLPGHGKIGANQTSKIDRYTESALKYLPRRAAGVVTTMWPLGLQHSGDPNIEKPSCRQRISPNEQLIPVGSEAHNLILPCVLTESISWDFPPPGISDFVTQDPYALQNVSIFTSRLSQYPLAGAAIAFNTELWAQRSQNHSRTTPMNTTRHTRSETLQGNFDLPDATVLSETLHVLLRVHIFQEKGQSTSPNSCRDLNTTIFGVRPHVPLFADPLGCFAYAKIKIHAGVVNFGTVRFVSATTFEGIPNSPLTSEHFQSNRWAKAALLLMKDVMLDLAAANHTSIPTWENKDNYIKILIHQSYLAAWGLFRSLEGDDPTFTVRIAEQRLVATIDRPRLWLWLALSILVQLSALVWYLVAQRSCGRAPILDPAVAALLTDASEVDKQGHPLRLTNLSYVTREDEKLGKLELISDDNGNYKLICSNRLAREADE